MWVGGALIVLLGIVAIASRGHTTPASTGAHDRGASQVLFNAVFTLWLLAMAAGALVLLYLLSIKRSSKKEEFRLKPLVGSLAFFAVIVIAMLLLTHQLGTGSVRGNRVPTIPGSSTLSAKERLHLKATRPTPPSFQWPLAAGLLALIVGASVTAFLRSARRRSMLSAEVTLEQELFELLDETLDDLRREADPRRAVIAAYARMERVMGAHGLPRRPSEAPLEYLRRVLVDLQVTEQAMRKLTALFERAKFSHHEIDSGMKEEAIEALVALQDDLRAVDRVKDAPTLLRSEVPRTAG